MLETATKKSEMREFFQQSFTDFSVSCSLGFHFWLVVATRIKTYFEIRTITTTC